MSDHNRHADLNWSRYPRQRSHLPGAHACVVYFAEYLGPWATCFYLFYWAITWLLTRPLCFMPLTVFLGAMGTEALTTLFNGRPQPEDAPQQAGELEQAEETEGGAGAPVVANEPVDTDDFLPAVSILGFPLLSPLRDQVCARTLQPHGLTLGLADALWHPSLPTAMTETLLDAS